MENSFTLDLQHGKDGEERAIQILNAHGWSITDLRENAASRYADIDFCASRAGDRRTIEIKNSIATLSTGNVALEEMNIHNATHGFKGWFAYCAADFIGFIIGTDLHIVPLQCLRDAARHLSLRSVQTYDGALLLLPLDQLKNVEGYCLLKGE